MKKMPIMFVGHGSPINAIEDNDFTRVWSEIAAGVPKPEAILCVSAHWVSQGTKITDSPRPRQIYDMYGFPRELYEVRYEPAGSPEFAQLTLGLVPAAGIDNSWGIDHGTWSVLNRMYPAADIPVFQMSLDQSASSRYHFEIGQQLKSLREKGILIIGSGNIVHNLSRISWSEPGGYSWADEFDLYIKTRILERDYQGVINYGKAGECAQYAFKTTEHFDPLLYVLGAVEESDKITIFNDARTLGSISMTGYLFE